ncbi:MAG: putative rhamnosyl transferase [Pararhodobacter sp.]
MIGLCRFSYPAIGGFQITHDDAAERARYLYEPARLEARFRFFEHVTLPCLRAQTDPDFTFLVVTGDDLPLWARERLYDLLSDLPQAVIRAHAPGPHRTVMQQAINRLRGDSSQPCLQFRLDDDDAVNLRFVERLRRVAGDAGALAARHRFLAIDFNHGHLLCPGPEGLRAAAVKRAYWAPALAMLARPGERLTVMNFNHARIWQHMPTLTRTDPDMFVRGVSPMNDSGFHGDAPLALLDVAGETLFRQAFGICADQLRKGYRAVV